MTVLSVPHTCTPCPPLPRHVTDVEDVATSFPCAPEAEDRVHTTVTGVVSQGPSPVGHHFSHAGGFDRGTGTMCHEQDHRAPAGSPVHLVPRRGSQTGPRLIQTNLQAPQAGSKLAKTGFIHPHLFPSRAGVNTPVGSYIKVG